MRYICIFYILLILLVPAFAAFARKKRLGLNRQTENYVYYFYGENNYKSLFISPQENLNSIALKIKNPNLKNNLPARLSLSNDKINENINFSGKNVGDGDWIRFTFPEIPDSKDKKFFLELSSIESSRTDALGINIDKESSSPAITTYHRINSHKNLIFDIYKNFLIKVSQDKLFISFWILFLISSLFTGGVGNKFKNS